MSWIKSNYHIAALGGGVLVLGGLGFLGYSGNAEVNESLVPPAARKGNTTTVEGGELAASVIKMVEEKDELEQRQTTEGRPVNLFTSVDLYIREGQPNKLLDLLKMPPVHPPIPNQWWVDHRLDLTYSDSPFMDPDGDGFNNREEYQAKTDPNDPSEVGDLISKLEVEEIQADLWRLEFRAKLSAGAQLRFFYKKHGGRQQTNDPGYGTPFAEGATVFPEEPGKDRFKLVKIETKKEQSSVGMIDRPYATFEDLRPNKKGQTYLLPEDPDRRKGELSKTTFADFTVVFRLNAVGQEGNSFKVEENGTFSLPPGKEEKTYKLAEVKLNEKKEPVAVVVEFTREGETKTIEIPAPEPKP